MKITMKVEGAVYKHYIEPIELRCPHCLTKTKHVLELKDGVQEVTCCNDLSSDGPVGCNAHYLVSFSVAPVDVTTYLLKKVEFDEDKCEGVDTD